MEKTRVSILNRDGEEIGAFFLGSINPQFNNKMLSRIHKIVASLTSVNISPDGTASSRAEKRIIARAEKQIATLFDSLMGYTGASQAFFGKVKPFAIVGGRFYCEQCLRALKQYILNEKEDKKQWKMNI